MHHLMLRDVAYLVHNFVQELKGYEKIIKELSEIHEVQIVNHLKATDIRVGLPINFSGFGTVKSRIMDKK